MKMIICGDETLKAKPTPRELNFVKPKGALLGSQIDNVLPAVYKQYFTSTFPACPPNKFEIVKKKDADFVAVTDGEVKLASADGSGSMSVSLDKGIVFNNEYFLQATSLGGVKSQQRL